MASPGPLHDRINQLELQLRELNGGRDDMTAAGAREDATTEEQLEKVERCLRIKVQIFPLYNAFKHAVKHHPSVHVESYEVTTGADSVKHLDDVDVYVLQERIPLQFTPWESGGFPRLEELPANVRKAAAVWCLCVTAQVVLLPALERLFQTAGEGTKVKMMDLDPHLNVGFKWANRDVGHIYTHSVLLITDKENNNFVFDPTLMQLGWNQENEWVLPFGKYRLKYIAGGHAIRTESHLREWVERMRSHGEGPDTSFWEGIKRLIYELAGLNPQQQKAAKEELFERIEEMTGLALRQHKDPGQDDKDGEAKADSSAKA